MLSESESVGIMMLVRKGLLLSCFILSVSTQSVDVNNYILPKDVESISYNLTLQPNIESLSFKGTLVFTFKPVVRSVSKLILNAKNLVIDSRYVLIEDDIGNSIPVRNIEEQKEFERLIIVPASPFKQGRFYSILFKYQGSLNEDGTGLYRSSYTDNLGVEQWMLVSQMRPVHTRKVFPCLDDPSFRAKFRLTVLHHPSYEVISNMPSVRTTLISDDAAVTEFVETPPIPVFLTGLLMSRLDSVVGDRNFKSLAIPQEIEAAVYSAQIGPLLASAMESLVHIQYPQVKTHQVALPRLVPIAMENWGLFNFRKENILYQPGVSPTVQRQTVARFSGHEVAHAWLGNSVTIAWWDFLWLSEMFAMYLEYYLPHVVDPKWRMEEQMVVDLHMSGLAGDSLSADPLTTRVLTPQEISAKFMGLTYTKGPGLLRMVQHVLTHNQFFKGIQTYLERHWGGSVTPQDLWECLEEQGNFPTKLNTIMATWTEQPGYPLISVRVENNAAVITQSAYTADGNVIGNGSWWVPISYTTSDQSVYDSRPKVWLPPGHQVSIPLGPHSIILLNIHSSGFFRVNYDEDLWARLSYQLQESHRGMPPLNRAQLVDDALELAKSGYLRTDTALELISYLAGEVDFIVWKAASTSLLSFADLLVDTDVYPLYKRFVSSLVTRVFKLKGLHELSNDQHVDRVLRELVTSLFCRMGNEDCNNAAAEYFNALRQGQPLRTSPDVKAALLCTAVQEGGTEAWSHMISLYTTEGVENRAQYLSALACTNDQKLIDTLLITPETAISDDEWRARFAALASRRENANNLLNTLHNNINTIISRFGTKGLQGFVSQIRNYLNNRNQSYLLGEFQRLGFGDFTSERNTIDKRMSWLIKNTPIILKYFKSNKNFVLIFNA